MLEFIIALLLSFGFQADEKVNLSDLDSATMDKIRADEKFEELGGDLEFNSLFKPDEGNSSPEDDIVITIDPNPAEYVQ